VCARNGDRALRQALVSAVNNRTATMKTPDELVGLDVGAFARKKLRPMVQGLFPADEGPTVLELLGRSIVFLTSCNIEPVLQETPFVATAWKLANLYLQSCGADSLSGDAPKIAIQRNLASKHRRLDTRQRTEPRRLGQAGGRMAPVGCGNCDALSCTGSPASTSKSKRCGSLRRSSRPHSEALGAG
jgi:hypothetical protein